MTLCIQKTLEIACQFATFVKALSTCVHPSLGTEHLVRLGVDPSVVELVSHHGRTHAENSKMAIAQEWWWHGLGYFFSWRQRHLNRDSSVEKT